MPWLRSLALLLLLTGFAGAADWPQWLGPKRNGHTPEKVAPWQGDLKVLWRHPAGEGNSGPVVADGRVFLFEKVRNKLEEQLSAYDAVTGRILWKTPYVRPELKTLYGNGPRGTPAVAGKRVFTYGITGIVTCFDVETGQKKWQVDAAKEFSPPRLLFGASCSPLVVGDAVLINVGGKDSAVVAFAADSGKVLWKNLNDGASYASPILFQHGEIKETIFLAQSGLIGVNPGNGQLHWRFPFKDLILESSTTPVQSGQFLVASSITLGTVGVRLDKKDGRTVASQTWKNPNLTCYFSTPITVGQDHLYAVVGVNPLATNPFAKKRTKASLRCVDIHNGKELWTKEDVGTYHATLMQTGDHKLLMLEEPGNLVLVEPNPKEYRELARTKICGNTWAHHALSNGLLYVRDGRELICLSVK